MRSKPLDGRSMGQGCGQMKDPASMVETGSNGGTRSGSGLLDAGDLVSPSLQESSERVGLSTVGGSGLLLEVVVDQVDDRVERLVVGRRVGVDVNESLYLVDYLARRRGLDVEGMKDRGH